MHYKYTCHTLEAWLATGLNFLARTVVCAMQLASLLVPVLYSRCALCGSVCRVSVVLSFAGIVAFFIWTKSSLFFKLDLGLTLSSELGFTTPGSLCFLYLTGFSVSCLLVFWYLVFPSHP